MLEVKDLQLTDTSPRISFSVRSGEILGIAGMVGSGRSEMIRAVFGADGKYAGEVKIKGLPIKIRKPRDAIKHKIALVSEDRHNQSLSLTMSVGENITLVSMNEQRGLIYPLKQKIISTRDTIKKFNIKTTTPFTPALYLSGGNQQKVAIAKWLEIENDIILFDEPTRGIDINSKGEIYMILSDLVKMGKAIIMISSDMPELIAMSDRLLIMRNGEVAAFLEKEEITEKNIILKAVG